MKRSSIFVLTFIIFAHAFQVQASPQAGIPKAVPGKKTSTKKSTSSSPKEKPVKEEEASDPVAREAASPNSPNLKDKLPVAIALALSIGKQSDPDDPLDKIKIMLDSAKLLVGVSPNDGRFLVADAAALLLERKKKEQRADERRKIAAIERELVAIYSKLDPEKSEEFIKESLDAAKKNNDNGSQAAKARAEKMAELAKVLIDNGVPEGVDLLLKSIVETGRVADAFRSPFRTVIREPKMKERMSAQIKQAFSGKIIADPWDLTILAILIRFSAGKDSSSSIIKAAILELEINSLRQLVMALRSAHEEEQPLPYNSATLADLYRFFVTDLRNMYSEYLPSRLNDVDLCLQGIQELIPFEIGEREQGEKATTFEEKLAKASGISDGTKRERELINLALDVLNKHITDYSRELMIDKILNALNSNDSRTLVKDAGVIADIKELAIEKNFVQAAQEAQRISRGDWRAQVLAGAASGLDKTDQEAAEALYIKALYALNDSDPGTAVIRTTLLIAERTYEKNPGMGRQFLDAAVRFANHTKLSETVSSGFPFDRGLYAQIGSVFMMLGFEPGRIQDALRDFDFGKMVKLHWQAMYEASLNIENKMLRATFLLKMCEAVINQSSLQSAIHGPLHAKIGE